MSPARRAHDAYAALAHLRTLPYVDSRHVGLMGGSHGGSTTLATMATRAGNGFAAAVALYPSCAPGRRGWHGDASGIYHTSAPVLILIGERDDWTPAAPCVKFAEEARQAGKPVAIKVYPGAHHSVDSDRPVRFRADRVDANAPGGARRHDRRRPAGVGGQHPRGRRVLRPPSPMTVAAGPSGEGGILPPPGTMTHRASPRRRAAGDPGTSRIPAS